ncbi:hypothetical protein CVT26_001457, partial [Gymnopilus dilepis]
MSTKHLYDSSEGLVLQSLRGAVAFNPSLGLHEPSKTVFVLHSAPSASQTITASSTSSANPTTSPSSPSSEPITTSPTCTPTPRRTAVISGGGSGHEPAHAGYTGRCTLSASVAGDIFASPSAKQTRDKDQRCLHGDLAKIDLYASLLGAPTDATAWVGARRWDVGSVVASASASEGARWGGEEPRRVLELAREGASTSGETAAGEGAGGGFGAAPDTSALDGAGPAGGSDAAPSPNNELTELDTLVGDSDCGDSFATRASGLLQALDSGSVIIQNVELFKVVSQVADVLEDRMGGTIGALFAIFLNALSAALSAALTPPSSSPTSTSTSSASTPGSTPTPW